MLEEKIKQIIRTKLTENNCGIYFKGHSLLEMRVNGESSMYKINDVRIDELEGAISEELKCIFEGTNSQGDTECQENKTTRDSNEM